MGKVGLAVALVALPVAVVASPGVQENNYRVGVSASSNDIADIYTFLGEGRFAIANYTGLSLHVGYLNNNGKNNWVDSKSLSIGPEIFLRKYDLGNIGFGYTKSRSEVEVPAGVLVTNKIYTNTYSLFGNWYLGDFDLSAGRSKIDSDINSSNYYTSGISASYYANNNLKMSLATPISPHDHDVYSVSVIYQPEAFKNAVGVSAGYAHNNNSSINHSVSISIQYYFDTKVKLKDRDRKY